MSVSDGRAESILSNGERFGIVGGGEVAKALIFPLFNKGVLNPTCVYVSDCTDDNELNSWREYGCSTTAAGNYSYKKSKHQTRITCWSSTMKNDFAVITDHVTSMCDIVLWAIDATNFRRILSKGWNVCQDKYTKGSSLQISVMPSISLEEFRKELKENLDIYSKDAYELRVARAIVNEGALLNAACTLVAISSTDMETDSKIVDGIFGTSGTCIKVASETQGLVCSLLLESGMGLIMPIIEAMCDGAVKEGAPRELSYRMIITAIKGAAELLSSEGKNPQPAAWKDRICVPGGATIAGIEVMERNAVRYAMMSAVAEAFKRSKELGDI